MHELELKKPMTELALFQERFNIHLKSFLDTKINSVTNHTKNPSIIGSINHAREIILGPGKRIRPYIAFLMYKSLGGQDDEEALKLLVGLEIFHSFGLTHDDIIDNGKLRHGEETSHTYITGKLKKEKRRGDLEHVGKSQAILIGDLLFTWSLEIISHNERFDPKRMEKVRSLFHEMAEEVAVGQMVDVDITTRTNVSKEDIDEKTRLKTAGYSFIKPLQIGAALSGNKTNEIVDFCKEFGLRMGIAFQTQDDLLDINSNDSELGKTSSLDKSQNQHTYFTHFQSSEYGKGVIKDNFRKAREAVEKLKLADDYKQQFFDLIEIIENRTS